MPQPNTFVIDSRTRKRLRSVFYRCLIEEHEDGGVLTDKTVGTRTFLTMTAKNGATKFSQEQVIFNGILINVITYLFYLFIIILFN